MRGKYSFFFPPHLLLQVRFHSSACSSFNNPFLYFSPARNPSCIHISCEASLLSNTNMQPHAPSHILVLALLIKGQTVSMFPAYNAARGFHDVFLQIPALLLEWPVHDVSCSISLRHYHANTALNKWQVTVRSWWNVRSNDKTKMAN